MPDADAAVVGSETRPPPADEHAASAALRERERACVCARSSRANE